MEEKFEKQKSSVADADPGSGAFLTPDPKPIFLELDDNLNFWVKSSNSL
jgi:hypothetical protein